MKIVGIISDNHITGVQYGVIEIADTVISYKTDNYKSPNKKTSSKISRNNKKRYIHAKVKQNKNRTNKFENSTSEFVHGMRLVIPYSYVKSDKKKPINLNRKQFKKAITLYKKNQRHLKFAQQNIAVILSIAEQHTR